MDKRALRAEARRVRAAVGDRARRSAQICAQVQALRSLRARTASLPMPRPAARRTSSLRSRRRCARARPCASRSAGKRGRWTRCAFTRGRTLRPGPSASWSPGARSCRRRRSTLCSARAWRSTAAAAASDTAADITIDIWEKFTHFCSEYAILIASSAPCPRERTTCSWTRSHARRAILRIGG